MTTEIVIPAEIEDIFAEELGKIVELVGTAESLTITTDDEYTAADELLGTLKASLKAADERRVVIKAPYLDATRAIDGGFKPVKEAYDRGEQAIKRGMVQFRQRREQEAREREAKLRDQEEKARQRLLARAETAEGKGQEEKADQLREQAASMPVAQVAPVIPKTGTSYRKVWKFEIVDETAVVDAFKVPDRTAIQKIVEAQGDRAVRTVGGIRVWQEEVAVARGRR